MSVIFYIIYMIENYKLPSLQLFLIKIAGPRNLTGLLKCLSGNRLTHCSMSGSGFGYIEACRGDFVFDLLFDYRILSQPLFQGFPPVYLFLCEKIFTSVG